MDLKIEYLRLDEIKPYSRNTRKHEEYDVRNIAKSIEKYGMNDPIGIWGKNNTIVEGHGRYEACKRLGIEEVPCIRLDHMSDKERREYAIAHNKTAELSRWDYNILDSELVDLDLTEFDFDFTQVLADGFDDNFTLNNGEKPEICQMTFTLHEKQKSLIEYAIDIAKGSVEETFGNSNMNGNALYEVVKEWAEQRK